VGWAGDIEFEGEPVSGPTKAQRPAWLGWQGATAVLAATTVAAVVVALHYRSLAESPRPSAQPATATAPFVPRDATLLSRHLPLRVGAVRGVVTLDAATVPNQGVVTGAVTVTAVLHGLPTGARAVLAGGDCSAPRRKVTWARGVVDSSGTAFLAGRVFQLTNAHDFYLTLGPDSLVRRALGPDTPPPGVNGDWLNGNISVFPTGGAPCL
jgi:hypothetical protein